MPACSESAGPVGLNGRSCRRMVPASGACTPKITLQRVDLPAPFSPSRQWTSPARTESETPSRAVTVPNRFVRPASSSKGAGGSGLQNFDLAREQVLLDLVELGRHLRRLARADRDVGSLGPHGQPERLELGLPGTGHQLIDGVL